MQGKLIQVLDRCTQRLLDYRYSLMKELHQLRAVTLEVTNRCNLRCRHCYANAGPKGLYAVELSTADYRLLAHELKREFGRVSVAITGGEPLMRDDLFEILSAFHDAGFPTSLSTNGVLLTAQTAAKLAQLVSAVSISIDGLGDTHNYIRQAPVYRSTLQSIERLKQVGVETICIKTAVTAKAMPELEGLRELIGQMQVSQWHIFPFEPKGRGEQARELELSMEQFGTLSNFILESKKLNSLKVVFGEEAYVPLGTLPCNYCRYRRCQAGISSVSVLPDGAVVKCIGAKRIGELIEGNIADGGLKQVWEDGFKLSRAPEYRSCGMHSFEEGL